MLSVFLSRMSSVLTPSRCLASAAAAACLLLSGVFAHAQGIPKALPADSQPVPRALPAGGSGLSSSPGSDLFDTASLAYERQEWQIAAQNYAQYLQQYPNGKRVADALFRIGECYREQRMLRQAATYWEEVVNRYPASEGAPSAAYRLGAIAFNNAQNEIAAGNKAAAKPGLEAAAGHFAFCEARTKAPEAKLAALHNKSRCYELLGDTKKQIEALNILIAVTENNPYRDSALLSLANIQLTKDQKEQSLKSFLELAQQSQDPAILADASLRAAVLYAEIGKPDEAIELFKKALSLPETTEVSRGIALVGIIQALYAKGDYTSVINYYNQNADTLPPGTTRPKMLLLVGHSYRSGKSYARAIEVYLIIEQYHKETEEAFEAGYWKLYCFYLLNDKDLAEFAGDFITRYTPTKGDHEYLSLARLIRADYFYNKGDYNNAAQSYTDLRVEKLPEKLRAGTLFNMGWAQGESGRHQEAVSSFTKFLTDYPGHEYTAKALARRGLANKDARDLPKAKADFEQVTKDHPKSEACELAWLQLGIIAMEQKDSKAAISAFESLLKLFPATNAAAQAWYGIGRGYFDLKNYDKAIPALRHALQIDSKVYFERASQMLILCDYARQNTTELAKTIDSYLSVKTDGSVQPNILKWLGLKFYTAQEFPKAARYLELAATPDNPGNTEAVIWIYLSMSQLESGNYDQSIAAADYFLQSNPDVSSKARALLTKGRAQQGKSAFDDGNKTAEDALSFVKDGKLQAELLILQGDILDAHGDDLAKQQQQEAAREKWKAATGKYAVPSQVFEDENVTPEALHKAARTLDKLGDTDQAQKLRQQLKQRYPKWAPKA
ncbi:MAG: tetratricopeptide repeat protein [Verrucomicrobiaceae bacterium]|nr:tetratricopeptide repeat protein [Verrucomicrobiaceae bacterium]